MRARTLLGATGGALDAPPAPGPIKRARRIAMAAGVAVVLAVAGCGGDDGDREQRPADAAGGGSGVAVPAEKANEAPERPTRTERRARRSHEDAAQVSSGTSAPRDGERSSRHADDDAPPLPPAGSDRSETRTPSGGTSKPPQARLQASSPPAETPAGTSGAPPSPGG